MRDHEDYDFIDEVTEAFDYKDAPLETVIAYGSGAFRQEGYAEGEQPMVDFIFAVDNPDVWHGQNVQARPSDYSKKGLVRSTRQRLQNVGGALWYHPYIDFGDREIKYGVIASSELEKDCRTWDRLYAAGRLQKPTNIQRATPSFEKAQSQNLLAANAAALLLADSKFEVEDHYTQIAGLSYIGDPRMIKIPYYGPIENPAKVRNIVAGNLSGFEALHGSHLDALSRQGLVARLGVDSSRYERSDDPEDLRILAEAVPFQLPNNPRLLPLVLKTRIALTVFKTGVLQPLKSRDTTSVDGQKRYLEEKRAKSKRKK